MGSLFGFAQECKEKVAHVQIIDGQSEELAVAFESQSRKDQRFHGGADQERKQSFGLI